MSLTYGVLLEPLEADGVRELSAVVPDLPGCVAAGDTPEEALANVEQAVGVWIADARECGVHVPHPRRRSGRFTVRVPAWIHAELETVAALENVSLNPYVASVLAYHLGHRSAFGGIR
jgi:antitoxin HicB